jgi:hypothetical protein
MKVHKTVSCESRLMCKQDDSCKLCVYNAFCEKLLACTIVIRNVGLHSLDVTWVGVIAHGEFSRQAEHRYLQQLQFFAHWFRELLPLFSGGTFFTHVGWGVFAHLIEYHTPSKPVTFLGLCILLDGRMSDELGSIRKEALVT